MIDDNKFTDQTGPTGFENSWISLLRDGAIFTLKVVIVRVELGPQRFLELAYLVRGPFTPTTRDEPSPSKEDSEIFGHSSGMNVIAYMSTLHSTR